MSHQEPTLIYSNFQVDAVFAVSSRHAFDKWHNVPLSRTTRRIQLGSGIIVVLGCVYVETMLHVSEIRDKVIIVNLICLVEHYLVSAVRYPDIRATQNRAGNTR